MKKLIAENFVFDEVQKCEAIGGEVQTSVDLGASWLAVRMVDGGGLVYDYAGNNLHGRPVCYCIDRMFRVAR